jgi:hypothetical protein
MGYATITPYSLLEISSVSKPFINITTIPTLEADIGNFMIPLYRGLPDYAYLDVIIHSRKDVSGATNYIAGGAYVGIIDGVTLRNGGNFPAGTLNTPLNTRAYANFILRGTTNIASYVTSGATQMAFLGSIASFGDSLELYDISGSLRMYFAVR